MLSTLLGLALLQDAAEVAIGDAKIAVRVQAIQGQRGPATMEFAALKRGEGILVAFARDRHAHFYHWSRGGGGRRTFDVAFLKSDGEITEVVALLSEELGHPEPPRGISAVKGITSADEIRFALFLPPNSAGRSGVRNGVKAKSSDRFDRKGGLYSSPFRREISGGRPSARTVFEMENAHVIG